MSVRACCYALHLVPPIASQVPPKTTESSLSGKLQWRCTGMGLGTDSEADLVNGLSHSISAAMPMSERM